MSKLHYQFSDHQKPVILLLHGFLGSIQQWTYLEKEFTRSFSILKIDLPGHGDSCEFKNDYTLEELCDHINTILIDLGIDTVHVVGHSMGGYLGCAFAKAETKKVASLTLINSISSSDPEKRKAFRNRSLKFIEKYPKAYLSMAINNLFTKNEHALYADRINLMKLQASKISNKSITQAIRCMRDRKSYKQELKNLNIPVHYIHGLKDEIIPIELAENEASFLKNKIYKVDGGHMTLLINVKEISELVHFIE